jgi:hypothetical protein
MHLFPNPCVFDSPKTVAASTLVSGLIAGWTLNEAAGGPYADVLGVRTMLAVGSPGSAAGKIGNAATSPTTADYLDYTDLLFSSGSWSVAGWLKVADTTSTAYLFAQIRATVQTKQILGVSISTFGLVGWSLNDTAFLNESAPGLYSANTWFHLALTYDGTNGRLYVDGVLRDQQLSPVGYPTASPHTRILGFRTRGNGNGAQADEVYAWSKALSDGGVSVNQTATGEIAELYAAGLAGKSYPF